MGGELVPKVLKWATEEVDNPDCRDRGFMYWRLLSTDPATAKKIVLADKPAISTETDRMDRQLLDQLLLHGATLSSIFHRQPQTFIRGAKARYIPDSAALDETARRHASSHIYSKPVAKGPYLTSSKSTSTHQAQKSSNGDDGRSDLASSAAVATSNLATQTTTTDDQLETSEDGPLEVDGNGEKGEEQERGMQGVDPYSMLGDDFGGVTNGGYAVDVPMPKTSAIDDLLL